jgi:hypothetical protein
MCRAYPSFPGSRGAPDALGEAMLDGWPAYAPPPLTDRYVQE